jgi:hypothetical protein
MGFQPAARGHICYVCIALKIAHWFVRLGTTYNTYFFHQLTITRVALRHKRADMRLSVHRRYMRRSKNQLDATWCFIALMDCSTYFGHSYAHHQEPHAPYIRTGIVSGSWWWAYECPKYVEQFIRAIKHQVTSSWFFLLHIQKSWPPMISKLTVTDNCRILQ